jgi:F-type H+-transporting ATPase subunit b
VLAQVVNFLILVVLLRHFLFRPIIRVMDRREATLGDQMAAAARSRAEADEHARALETERRELEEHRQLKREEVERELERWREAELDLARADIERSEERWRESLAREQAELQSELEERVGRLVATTMRRALPELTDASLESQAVRVFLQRLEQMDPAAREEFARARASGGPAVVQSAFELRPEDRAQVEETMNRLFPPALPVRFETTPDLICGVALRVGGYTAGWNLRDFLRQLEEDFVLGLREGPHDRREDGA